MYRQERRIAPRKISHETVYLLWESQRMRCRVVDFSSRGFFVRVHWPSVISGTTLEAVFPFRNNITTVLLRRAVRVVRVEDKGLALTYLPKKHGRLQQAKALHTERADPANL